VAANILDEFKARHVQASAWANPTPIPNALLPVDPFNSELLPPALRKWVMDIADRMQCPPDFPAVGAMVALSSVIGRKACIRPKRHDDWQVVPNLWGAIVGLLTAM
jgi:putative DNA primase/helicase